jgi:hypothetical protein
LLPRRSMNMPYREKIIEFCAFCGETTPGARCRRCERPLCEVHAHKKNWRCQACEEEYVQGRGRVVGYLGLSAVLIIMALLIIMTLFQHSYLLLLSRGAIPPIFIGLFFFFLLGPALSLVPLVLRRRLFLAKRHRTSVSYD